MILTYLKLDLATYWQFPINGICLVFACPSVNVLVRVSCFLVINLIGLYDVYFYLLRFVFHISSKDNIAILLIQLRLYEHFCYESILEGFSSCYSQIQINHNGMKMLECGILCLGLKR